MIGLHQFLTKVVLADGISQELRQEALMLRDSINEDCTITYQDKVYSKVQIDQCFLGTTKAITFIKNLRSVFKMGLKEAKDLSDYLRKTYPCYQYKD